MNQYSFSCIENVNGLKVRNALWAGNVKGE